MKNKLIVLFIIFGICVGIAFTNALIPRFRPFGTSTSWTDSTNYVVLNKGYRVLDSMRVEKDLFVGTGGGFIYLDTNRLINLTVSGNQFYITNDKQEGWTHFEIGNGASAFRFSKTRGENQAILLDFDTVKFQLKEGDYSVSGGTQQYKMSGDTASDFDSDDDVILNTQTGVITTKALTTIAGTFYEFILENSLITTTSKIFYSLEFGTNTREADIKRISGLISGKVRFQIKNEEAIAAFDGTLKIHYFIINKSN